MPVGTGGKWYEDPQAAVAADLGFTLIEAAGTTTYSFDSEDYDTLLGILKGHEFYKTVLTGTNNDFVVTSRASGTSPLTIALVDPAANSASLSVSKATNAISVSLATGSGGAITSTASQVVSALNSDADSAPHVFAQLAAGNDGSGVVTALAAQGLADWTGTTPTLDVTLETQVDDTNWYLVGTAFAQKNGAGTPGTTAEQGRAFSGLGVRCRWKAVAGGTTPGIVFSIDVSGKK